jgi:hypothetical protein
VAAGFPNLATVYANAKVGNHVTDKKYFDGGHAVAHVHAKAHDLSGGRFLEAGRAVAHANAHEEDFATNKQKC